MHLIEQLKKGLHTGFIQYQKDSLEEYDFSLAFVTNSGIASLINTLKALEEKGVQGKIIVSL